MAACASVEDGGCSDRVAPGGRHLEGPRDGDAFSVEGFLAPAHVGLVAGQTFPPCDRVAGRSVLKARSVREDGQAGPVESLRFQHRCDLFLDRGGRV